MFKNLEVYKKAINFLMNLEDSLTDTQREELEEILEQAREALPPELLESLKTIQAELLQAVMSDEDTGDSVANSYLRDL